MVNYIIKIEKYIKIIKKKNTKKKNSIDVNFININYRCENLHVCAGIGLVFVNKDLYT